MPAVEPVDAADARVVGVAEIGQTPYPFAQGELEGGSGGEVGRQPEHLQLLAPLFGQAHPDSEAVSEVGRCRGSG